MRPARPFAEHAVVAIGAILSLCLIAWLFGQDVNWDRQNYHAYDAFALLHWRFGRDTVPAGPQTYLDAVPYLPPYVLARVLGPLAGGIAEAALQSVSVFALWLVARRVACLRTALLATATGATAAMALAEIGTSLDELLLAATPLVAIRLVCAGGTSTGPASYAWAGLLTGLPAGLKLPMVTLSIALCVAVAFGGPDRLRWRAVLATGLGEAAGFLLTGGVWAGHLWIAFGNPFFPFLNDIFHAPAAAAMSFGDPRFHFKGVLHALWIPLGVAEGRAPTAETPFRDVRDLAAIVVAIVVLAVRHRRLAFLSVYLLAGEAAWLLLCPIERYAVPLDMLGGAVVVLAIGSLPRRAAARLAASALAAALLMATTRRADFFHRPWSDIYVARPPRLIGPDSVELLLGAPLGYWVAATPHPARAASLYPTMLAPGGKLARRLDATIAAAGNRLRSVALDIGLDPAVRFEMGLHGIALDPPCERAESMVWVATVFCHARRVGPRDYGASDLPTGETVAFSASGHGWIYEISGWDATEADGTWATGPHARLAFVDPDRRSLVADITVSAVAGAAPRTLRIDAAGRVTTSRIGPLGTDVTIPACIGPDRAPGGVTVIDFFVSDTRSMAELGLGPETRPLAFRMHRLVFRPGLCPGPAGPEAQTPRLKSRGSGGAAPRSAGGGRVARLPLF